MLPRQLKSLLNEPGRLIRLAGAHDPLGARLVEEAGYDGVWASSLEISTACGCLDTDAVTMPHVLPAVAMMSAVARCPIVADCGTGGPSPVQVGRMVRSFAEAGAAGVCLEDAECPCRNSLLPGCHNLASAGEFAGKLRAALKARRGSDLLLIARVEALIAGAGLDEALRRARIYAQAGADAILIHSKKTNPAEILEFVDAWDGSLPLVIVPTTYHILAEQQLRDYRKVKMVIYANQAMRAAICAMRKALAQVYAEETAHGVESWIAPLKELLSLQGAFPSPCGVAPLIAQEAPIEV